MARFVFRELGARVHSACRWSNSPQGFVSEEVKKLLSIGSSQERRGRQLTATSPTATIMPLALRGACLRDGLLSLPADAAKVKDAWISWSAQEEVIWKAGDVGDVAAHSSVFWGTCLKLTAAHHDT